jgi:hypothetical protein
VALADFDAYVAAMRANRAADFQSSSGLGRAGRLNAVYRSFVPAPVVPTTSVALDKTSAVAMGPIPNVGSGRLSILGGRINPGGAAGVALILVDLLNHSGGISGTVTTEQTTNLPTAALTRYTSGEGVMAGLLVLSTTGSTATTFTVSYTNQAGTSGRTSTATQIGGSNFNVAGTLVAIPLEGGDTGIRSVESVTLASSTVSTPGNLGVVMWKPLAMMALNDYQGAHVIDAVSSGGFVGALAEVHRDACLSVLGVPAATQALGGAILLAEV